MITRIQNISDLAKDPPRFKDQIDLLGKNYKESK